MSAGLRMLWFHLRLFARNTYFAQLIVTSTLSILALQLLAAHGNDSPTDTPIWLRAAMVGTWSVCTVSAGMIGFQRFQGTLVHLVTTPRSPMFTLLPLVASAATFGLLAFPLAAAGASLFGYPPIVSSWPVLMTGIVCFWLACLSLSAFVSAVFVLTPNAITYEGLLTVPLILISGVFGTPEGLPSVLTGLAYALPTTPAVRLLTEAPEGTHLALLTVGSLVATAAWFALARWATSRALRRARITATLEVI